MPCYEPTPVHSKRYPEFLVQALCEAMKHIPDTDLDNVPGLREWKKRHEAIDSGVTAHDYDNAQGIASGYEAPLFMSQWLRENP